MPKRVGPIPMPLCSDTTRWNTWRLLSGGNRVKGRLSAAATRPKMVRAPVATLAPGAAGATTHTVRLVVMLAIRTRLEGRESLSPSGPSHKFPCIRTQIHSQHMMGRYDGSASTWVGTHQFWSAAREESAVKAFWAQPEVPVMTSDLQSTGTNRSCCIQGKSVCLMCMQMCWPGFNRRRVVIPY